MSTKSLRYNDIARNSTSNSQIPMPPVITGYSISGLDDTALDPAGGQTVLVNGKGFQKGATITFNGSAIAVVTWVNANQLSFTTPAYAAGTYQLYVVNSDGGTAIYIPGVVYSSFPTWTTSQGTIGSSYETKSFSSTVVANGDAPLTYSLYSGSLPSGVTLSSGGVVSGTLPVDSGSTTYTFTVKADDAQLQSSTRQFSITVNTDVVTWVTPSSGATINLDGSSYSQVLSATDAASYSVSYTANALPTGLTLTSGTISGTPTVEGSTTTLLTATAATSGRSSTNTVTWVVSLNDSYWKYATLLLTAGSIQTSSFVSDNSNNNQQLTVYGDARANSANPYQHGYYSTYYDGSSGVLTTTASSNYTIPTSTTPFTVECWCYITSTGGPYTLICTSGSTYSYSLSLGSSLGTYDSTLKPWFGFYSGSWGGVVSSVTLNRYQWYHVAGVFTGSLTKIYVDGVEVASGAPNTWGVSGNGTDNIFVGRRNDTANFFYGQISNARVVIGSAVYTTAFTPPTTPLQSIPNTKLLTCQSNRFVDNSPYNAVLSLAGTPAISMANPFSSKYQLSTQYYSTSFNGSTDYLTFTPGTTCQFGTGDFTVECWIFPTKTLTTEYILEMRDSTHTNGFVLAYGTNVSGSLSWYNPNGSIITENGTYTNMKAWNHIAVCRASGVTRLFVNGMMSNISVADTYNYNNTNTTAYIGSRFDQNSSLTTTFPGLISNLRVVKGTAIYTTSATTQGVQAFIPPSSPLTAVTNTTLLTLQDSNLKDNSSNNLTISSAGSTAVKNLAPFYPTYYSNYTNGTTDYLSVASNSVFTFGTSDHTIEFWMFLNGTQGAYATQFKFSSGSTQQATNDYYFQACSAGGATFNLLLGGGGSWGVLISDASYYTSSLNKWVHLAITRSGNTFRLFANGVVVGSGTYAGSIGAQTGSMLLGNDGSSNYSKAYFTDFRVTTGQALYTGAFTPPTGPLTTTSVGTSGANVAASLTGTVQLLTCQSPYFVDNSTNRFAITKYGSTTITSTTPYAQPAIYSGSLLPATYGSGYFDGTGDYVKTVDTQGLNFGTGDFTVECWVWLDSTANTNASFFSTDPATTNQGIIMGRDLFGTFGSAGVGGASIALTVPTGTWTHCALTRASGSMRAFLNGVQTGATTSSSVNVNNTFGTIGARYVEATGYLWTGYISDLRVVKGTALYTSNFLPQFTSPLSKVANTQLLTLQTNGSHNNSTFNDSSSFSNLVTRSGNTTNGTFSPYGDNWSVYLPGSTSSYYTIPASSVVDFGTGNFTVEFWFNITPGATTNLSYNRAMMYGPSEGNNTNNFSITLQGSSQGSSGILVYHTSNIITYNTAVSQGVWHHIALTRNGTSVLLFLDGVQIGSATSSVNCTNIPINVGGLKATVSTYDDYFAGYISNLRITKGQALYTSAFTPSTTPLTASSNTSLLTAQSNSVIDNSTKAVSITINGTPSIQKFSPFGTVTVPKYYSTYFNGSSDFLYNNSGSTQFNLSTGDFTIECWVYLTALTKGAFIDFRNGAGTPEPPVVYVETTGVVYFYSAGSNRITGSTLSLNTWYHVAVTRASGSTKLFVNGSQVGSTYSDTNAYGTPAIINIGKLQDNTGYVTGYISNVRVIKGQAVVTGAYTPSTIPLTSSTVGHTGSGAAASVTGTVSLLTCQNNTFLDNSANNFTITAGTTTVKPLLVSPFTPTISTTPASYSPTTFGGSMYFDGTGDYLSVADSLSLRLGFSDFCVEYWIYPISTSVSIQIAKRINSSTYGAFVLDSGTGGGVLKFYASSTGSAYAINGATVGTFKVGQWNHIAVYRSGSNWYGSMNGIVSSLATATSITLVATTDPWVIGGDIGANYTNAYYADVKITIGTSVYGSGSFYPGSTPLAPLPATNLLLNGTSGGVIDSTRTVDMETVADSKVTNFSPYNGSYYSNYLSSSSYLTVPANAAYDLVGTGGTFTIEAWVYFNSYNSMASSGSYIATTYQSSNGWVWGFNGISTVSQLQYVAYTSGSGTQANVTVTTTDIPLGKWLHICTVNNNGTLTSYINGTQIGSSQAAPSYTGSGGQLAIGVYQQNLTYAGNPGWYIKDFRVVKGTAIVPTTGGPTAPLAAVANTSILTCQTNKFIDRSTNNATVTVNNGAVKVSTQNPFQVNTGQSYYFDGTGDYLTSGTYSNPSLAFGTGNFTIEYWVYMTDLSDKGHLQISNTSGGLVASAASNIYISHGSYSGKWQISVNGSGSGSAVGVGTTINVWHHIAMVRNNGTLNFYVDGTSIYSAADTYNYTGTYLAVGGYYSTSYLLAGYIADLRITKGYARTISVPSVPVKTN